MNINWFRSYHGAPSDSKLRIIEKDSGVHRAFITAIWWELLDYASQQNERGSVKGINTEIISIQQDIDEQLVQSVISSMVNKNMIENERLCNWDKRQQNSNSTERVRKHRASKANNNISNFNETPETKETIKEFHGTPSLNTDRDIDKKKNNKKENFLDEDCKLAKFEKFWKEFGNKKSKPRAFKAFKKALQKVEVDTILNSIKPYKAYLQKTGIAQKYPSTWLNQECWNDDYGDYSSAKIVNADNDSAKHDYINQLTSENTDQIRKYLIQSLGWPTYSSWFKETKIFFENGTFVIHSKTKFQASYIISHYIGHIEDSIKKMNLSNNVEVRYE